MGTRYGAAALSAERTCSWVEAHTELSRLARQRAALDAEEGRGLLCALRSAAHVHLGFGSFNEYIERFFGYKPRTTQEMALRQPRNTSTHAPRSSPLYVTSAFASAR
jgi:hypothetical protein